MSFLPSEDTYNIHKTCALEILSLSRMINEPFFPVFNSNSSARSLLMFGRCQGNDIRKAGMVLSHFLWFLPVSYFWTSETQGNIVEYAIKCNTKTKPSNRHKNPCTSSSKQKRLPRVQVEWKRHLMTFRGIVNTMVLTFHVCR